MFIIDSKSKSLQKLVIVTIIILCIMSLCLAIPQVKAEDNLDSPLHKEQIDESTYRITANTEREFTDSEKIQAVNELEMFTLGRIMKDENESIIYYNKIAASDYLQVRSMFYCEVEGLNVNIELNRDQYFNRSLEGRIQWDSPNGYMSSITNIFISKYSNNTKRIDLETAYFWLKSPNIWFRNDYVLYYWGTKPTYLPGHASGSISTMVHISSIYDEKTEAATFLTDISSQYMTFKGYMREYVGTWDVTAFNTQLSLISSEDFNLTVAYYHDQGVIPYDSFLNHISVGASGISVDLNGILCEVKEYRAAEPFLIEL